LAIKNGPPLAERSGMSGSPYTVTVDDDPLIAAMIQRYVGVPTEAFTTGRALLRRLPKLEAPIGVFLDIHLDRGERGLDLIPDLRAAWPEAPVIVVTGSLLEQEIADALAAGAHDFVRKPLAKAEVVARLRVRRAELLARIARDVLVIGDVRFDRGKRLLESLDQPSAAPRHLSATEAQLLECLIATPGALVDKLELRARVWPRIAVSENAVRKKIFGVRAALRDVSRTVTLETSYGRGVRLVVTPNPESHRDRRQAS
jgi:DNA-binding response OmpR family regulator